MRREKAEAAAPRTTGADRQANGPTQERQADGTANGHLATAGTGTDPRQAGNGEPEVMNPQKMTGDGAEEHQMEGIMMKRTYGGKMRKTSGKRKKQVGKPTQKTSGGKMTVKIPSATEPTGEERQMMADGMKDRHGRKPVVNTHTEVVGKKRHAVAIHVETKGRVQVAIGNNGGQATTTNRPDGISVRGPTGNLPRQSKDKGCP